MHWWSELACTPRYAAMSSASKLFNARVHQSHNSSRRTCWRPAAPLYVAPPFVRGTRASDPLRDDAEERNPIAGHWPCPCRSSNTRDRPLRSGRNSQRRQIQCRIILTLAAGTATTPQTSFQRNVGCRSTAEASTTMSGHVGPYSRSTGRGCVQSECR